MFLAKLQQLIKEEKDNLENKHTHLHSRLIVYAEDSVIIQLREVIAPTFEIVFESPRMPLRIRYAAEEITGNAKYKEIERICVEAINKYKNSLLRFDFIIFLKNTQEAMYLTQ